LMPLALVIATNSPFPCSAQGALGPETIPPSGVDVIDPAGAPQSQQGPTGGCLPLSSSCRKASIPHSALPFRSEPASRLESTPSQVHKSRQLPGRSFQMRGGDDVKAVDSSRPVSPYVLASVME
jgi:hypothetical protein